MNFPEALALFRRWMSPAPAFAASSQDRERVSKLAGAGRSHLMAARVAVDQRLFAPAATLYGRAIACSLEATRIVAPSGAAAKQADAASKAEPAAAPPATPGDFVAASPFGSTGPGRDALLLLKDEPIEGGKRSRRALEGLDRVVVSLGAGLYPATEDDVRRLRTGRRLAVGLALLAAAAGLGRCLTAPRNVARGKQVTASSVRFGGPQALVNGTIEWGTFGLHTGGSGHEWATIDLGDFYALGFAEIYGRGDGHLEYNLPLSVDLSDDGVVFRPAGACTDIFTQATPCVVPLAHQRARFVRVAAPEVVLSEVEVYAAP